MGIIPIIIYRDKKSDKELQEEMERETKWRKMIEEDEARKRAREERVRQEKIEAKRKREEAIRKIICDAEQKNPWEFMVLPGNWSPFGQFYVYSIPWDGTEEEYKILTEDKSNMKEIEFYPGESIDSAWKKLLKESAECEDTCFGKFNDQEILSTDTLDEAYMKIMGKTKGEYEKEMQDWRNDYERKEKEHKDSIPGLVPGYCERARGVILEDQYEYWDKIVPIRLDDLYHGMELDCTLDLCKIMRDESMSYDKRLRKAYKAFMDQGHSGMSAGLVASMLKIFCPDGEDLADAVMNFRFENK